MTTKGTPSLGLAPERAPNGALGQVSWLVRLAVKTDQLINFGRLTGEMMKSARTERGVLSYQRFVSADRQSIHVYERYSDSSAALEHLLTFRMRFGERFSTMVERRDFTVYGNPSDELRRELDGFGAQYLTPFSDLGYWQ